MADEVLRVRLTAEGTAELVAALRSVGATGAREARRFEQGWSLASRPLAAVRGALGALGVALSAGALIAFARQAANLADELDNARQKIGASIGVTTGLALAAKVANVDLGGLDAVFGKFSRTLRDFEDGGGGKAARALRQLGFEAGAFEGLDLAQSFVKVASRVAVLEDGFRKTALVTDAFGKAGARLVPLLNFIGREGMQPLLEQVNALFSPRAVKSAADFADRLTLAGFQLQGLGVNLVAGFAEPFTRALDGASSRIDPGLIVKLQRLGFEAGKFAGTFLLAFEDVADLVGVTFDKWGLRLGALGRAMAAAFTGNAAAAAAELQAANVTLEGMESGYQRRRQERLRDFRALESSRFDPARLAGGLGAAAVRGAPIPPGGAGSGADAALAATRAAIAAEEAERRRAYDRGESSLRAYFDARLVLTRRANAAEVAALRDRLNAVDNEDPERAERERQKIRGEIRAKEIEGQAREAALLDEFARAREKLDGEILDAQRKAAVGEEDRHAARLAAIAREADAYALALRQRGDDEKAVAQEVAEFRRGLELRADAERIKERADRKLGELAAARAAVEAEASAGLRSRGGAEAVALRAERAQLEELRALAAAARENANALGDPDALERAAALADSVRAIELRLEAAGGSARLFGAALGDAFSSGLVEFLTTFEQHVDGAGGAFKAFVVTVVQGLRRIAAELLQQRLLDLLVGLFGAVAGGGAGRGGGGTTGQRAVVPLPQARAAGGMVEGPGGPTSDSVPALLSRGEFVHRAQVVAEPGALHFLQDFNLRGMAALRAWAPGAAPARFAEGGRVGGRGTASLVAERHDVTGRVEVALGPGLVGRGIRSREGQKAVLEVLHANRRAARDLLGGGR